MTLGAFWVAMAASINAPWNYIPIRSFSGVLGRHCGQSFLAFSDVCLKRRGRCQRQWQWMAAAINAPWNYIQDRSFIGSAGATLWPINSGVL
jgi:hypothetical protein